MNFHSKSQVPSSKNGRVMAVGTKEDIYIYIFIKTKQFYRAIQSFHF